MKTKTKKRKIPKTVQESIPYQFTYANGVIETDPGTFTKSYALDDVNFKMTSDWDQALIFGNYGKILDSFSPDTRFQIVIHNHPVDKKVTAQNILYPPQNDDLNDLRQGINRLLIDNLTEGKSNLSQDKYLVVSVDDSNVEHAMNLFGSIDQRINQEFRKLSREQDIVPQSLIERLQMLYSVYNIEKQSEFFESD